MIKKLVSFVCCLLPIGANASVLVEPVNGESFVSTEKQAWKDAQTADESIVVSNGAVNSILSPTGFGLTGDMYVGAANDQSGMNGSLYIYNSVNGGSKNFTIESMGDMSLAGSMYVYDGWNLGIKSNDVSPVAFDLTIEGSIANNGILNIEDVENFLSGAIDNNGMFDLDAATVATGAIATSGALNIESDYAVNMQGLVSKSGATSTTITANGGISSSGTIQNNAGSMVLATSGAVTLTGSLENSGILMQIKGDGTNLASGVVTVAGTMKNDTQSGTMRLNVGSLMVTGGDASSTSFVNAGDFYATVSGQTHFEYGLNLSGMATSNVFSLETGTLTFGNNVSSDAKFGAFANNLDSFNLVVNNGAINTTTILNGANANADANMNIKAGGIEATSVNNSGNNMTLTATDLTVNGIVVAQAGANTNLIGDGAGSILSIRGAVSNFGNMLLSGMNIDIQSVSNSGEGSSLAIESLTSNGSIYVAGDVTNSDGETTIHAKEVSVSGTMTNNSGTMSLYGSDVAGGAVAIGGVNVAGGTFNLNALAGSVTVQNSLDVAATGTMNLGTSLRNLTVGDGVSIANNVVLGDATTGAGNMNVGAYGTPVVLTVSDGGFEVGGSIIATDDAQSRTLQVVSDDITVSDGVLATNKGNVVFGNADNVTLGTGVLDIENTLSADNGGSVEIYLHGASVGSMIGDGNFITHGAYIAADKGNINIDGNVLFDGTVANSGLIVKDTTDFMLTTTATGADINVGAVSVGTGNTLTFNSKDAVTVDGTLTNKSVMNVDAGGVVNVSGSTTNSGTFGVSGTVLTLGDVNNTGAVDFVASNGDVNIGAITTSGSVEMTATDAVVARAVSQTGGVMNVKASEFNADSFVIGDATGTQANIDADVVIVGGNVRVAGDLVQAGATDGMLNLNASRLQAGNLIVGGNFVINAGDTTYDVGTNVSVSGDIFSGTGSVATINAGNSITGTGLTNSSVLALNANNGIDLGSVVNNSGVLTLDSGSAFIDMSDLTMNSGNLILDGAGLYLDGAIATNANLYQGYTGVLADKDINIVANKYEITTSNLVVSNINQTGSLKINTSDVDVGGSIVATDLQFVAQKLSDGTTDAQIVNIGGNLGGGVSFAGLEKMTVGGDYTFNDNSSVNAIILPYATGAGSTDRNYWATVSLNSDNTLGQITNPQDATALITVAGKFETDLTTIGELTTGGALGKPQIGINITDAIDQGTAILFLQANEGVSELATKIRNLNVSFCNADGSVCYNYFDSLTKTGSNDEDDLPAYLSVRDINADGAKESLYIVFDPRFGGPVLIEDTKIQPIVARQSEYTSGEYVSAGALDNLIAGQLKDKGFYNRTPIEVIPLIFDGTNIEGLMSQLYNRMEYYVETSNGEPLARFSRLVQPREVEQIAGSVALNEHTAFRSFEDRMFDEFIWNRKRNLKKAWLDVDYGMFYQNVADKKHTDGNRFSVSGGFDWQESNTLVLGLTGRVSHTKSASADSMDLSYASIVENGRVDIDVADTNVGFGAYLMKILGEKARLYGNAFLDIHFFDISRSQNYVGHIDGDGHALSLLTEWGLMHDILNQYIVGNLYARAGYNFGFDVKEKVNGDDYMRMESDGYLVLTPGYSLIAQKRIYPSAWFQIRPYASIGVEYDVLGAPDFAKYKFIQSDNQTKYGIDIDPLWANIGGGVEMLSAKGVQVGLDYRYQYNSEIQLHNIRVSGSYRF